MPSVEKGRAAKADKFYSDSEEEEEDGGSKDSGSDDSKSSGSSEGEVPVVKEKLRNGWMYVLDG